MSPNHHDWELRDLHAEEAYRLQKTAEKLRHTNVMLLEALRMVRRTILRECLEMRFAQIEIAQIDAAIAEAERGDLP